MSLSPAGWSAVLFTSLWLASNPVGLTQGHFVVVRRFGERFVVAVLRHVR